MSASMANQAERTAQSKTGKAPHLRNSSVARSSQAALPVIASEP